MKLIHRCCLLACLLLLLCVDDVSCASHLRAESFAHIKSHPAARLVVFYRSSEPDSARVLNIVEQAAQRLSSLPSLKALSFEFAKVDGSASENTQEFAEASFHEGTYLFTSTPNEGIVKYVGPIAADHLYLHISHKFLDVQPDSVANFTSELDFYDTLDLKQKPVFVKFYETWCEHCKRLKQTFQQAATYFQDSVVFLDVECSASTESKSFCTTHGANSFPTLMLFSGEKKEKFDAEMRTIMTFDDFFAKHLDGYTKRIDDDGHEVSIAGSKPTKADKKSKKNKKEKVKQQKDDDDQDDSDEKKKKAAKKAAKKAEKQRKKEEKQKKKDQKAAKKKAEKAEKLERENKEKEAKAAKKQAKKEKEEKEKAEKAEKKRLKEEKKAAAKKAKHVDDDSDNEDAATLDVTKLGKFAPVVANNKDEKKDKTEAAPATTAKQDDAIKQQNAKIVKLENAIDILTTQLKEMKQSIKGVKDSLKDLKKELKQIKKSS